MISKKELKKLYLEEKHGSFKIAKIVGVDKSTVLRWLRNYNIPIRKGKEAMKYKRQLKVREKVWHISGYWRVWDQNSKSYKWLHRKIWEDNYGIIPEGYVVHHKNENSLDNNIDNLELMERKAHNKMHFNNQRCKA